MYVFSGLLLRVDNEAQLAMILGHENAHYNLHHTFKAYSKARAATSIAKISTIGGTLGAASTVMIASASLSSFSQSHEAESDEEGLRTIAALGYDPNMALTIWENVIAEQQASSNKRVRKFAKRSPIFASHPSKPDRAKSLKALAATLPTNVTRSASKQDYRLKIRPYLQEWLDAELENRDYGSMLHLIERLEQVSGDEGVLNYMRGRVYETRNEEGDKALMDQAWLAASQHADAPADIWRSMGDMYAREGKTDEAISAFKNYLAQSPAAPDKDLIMFMIADLETKQ